MNVIYKFIGIPFSVSAANTFEHYSNLFSVFSGNILNDVFERQRQVAKAYRHRTAQKITRKKKPKNVGSNGHSVMYSV